MEGDTIRKTVKMKEKAYTFFETTGDIGIYVKGKDLCELFTNAGKAVFEIITDVKNNTFDKREVVLTSDSLENLFIKWLNELIFLFDVYGIVATNFKITLEEGEAFKLTAIVYYYLFDSEKDEKKVLIKAATYHNFYLKKREKGYEAKVLFDI